MTWAPKGMRNKTPILDKGLTCLYASEMKETYVQIQTAGQSPYKPKSLDLIVEVFNCFHS